MQYQTCMMLTKIFLFRIRMRNFWARGPFFQNKSKGLLHFFMSLEPFVHCVKSVQIRSFFWSVFSHIQTEYETLRGRSLYSVRIWEHMNQKKLRIWKLFTQHAPNKQLIKVIRIKVVIIKSFKYFICTKPIRKISQYCWISSNNVFTNLESYTYQDNI